MPLMQCPKCKAIYSIISLSHDDEYTFHCPNDDVELVNMKGPVIQNYESDN